MTANSDDIQQFTDRVTIVEVAPRDGLQNDPRTLSTRQKIDLIDCLVDAGLTAVEPTSFVSPKAVPKMADAADVVRGLERHTETRFICLVPNVKGLERAKLAGVDSIAIFASATEEFSQANLNCSIEEAFLRFEQVVHNALNSGMWIRGYISVAFHCPYSGPVALDHTIRIAERLYKLGCHEICLSDTIGVASPDEVSRAIESIRECAPVSKLSLHVHDTHGRAIDNVAAAHDLGLRTFDGSAGGLGGCPFAPGAPGNIATESLVEYFHGRGVETGIDLTALRECVAAHLDSRSA